MKKRSVETTAIFTPAEGGYLISFPAVPGLTFHTVNQIPNPAMIEEEEDIRDALAALAQSGGVTHEELKARFGL